MSELKRYLVDIKGSIIPHNDGGFYLKSEADKVIADLDKEIVDLKEHVHNYEKGLFVIQATAEKRLRHQKYKRCLAMAKWCCDRWADIATQYAKSVWYRKWEKRWLELAEKFKEAK